MDLIASVKNVLAQVRGPDPTQGAGGASRVESLDGSGQTVQTRAPAIATGTSAGTGGDDQLVPRERDRGTRLDQSI